MKHFMCSIVCLVDIMNLFQYIAHQNIPGTELLRLLNLHVFAKPYFIILQTSLFLKQWFQADTLI